MKLNDFIENPDNPRNQTQLQIDRLKGKLERVPDGLKAIRIAYVTDKVPGKKTVLAGNTRLKALREIYGDNEVPNEYFQDITSMSEAERHEFIVTSNINDGTWDLQKLARDYKLDELSSLGLEDAANFIPQTNFNDAYKFFDEYTAGMKTVKCPHCGKENYI